MKHISEVMKEIDIGQKGRKCWEHASENFQGSELKINQNYLEDKTMKEKDDNRLKLKKEEMQR